MAKAVICDICRASQETKHAFRWRKLRLMVEGVTGESHNVDRSDGDDICSEECAKQWWERRLRSVFR